MPTAGSRDVFVCHAYVDKEEYVNPLAECLSRRGVSCWIDEGIIRPGMSIIDAINDGIGKARYVVVLCTENIGRNWPHAELNAAMSRELELGEAVVLPILVMDRRRYITQYPLLADKLYLKWIDGPEVIAERIAARFGREPSGEWHHIHPAKYVGLIWTRVVPSPAKVGRPHKVTLRWGPYWLVVPLSGKRMQKPISLVHHKTKADSIPLLVSVTPPAIVTCGLGPPPDGNEMNIDEGWQRTAGGNWPGHL